MRRDLRSRSALFGSLGIAAQILTLQLLAGCGSDCKSGGTCVSSNPCHTATLQCRDDSPVCTDTGNQPNGTSCGTNRVCSDGSCVACAAGSSCASTNPCHTAEIACSSGSPVCTDKGDQVDGTTCGTNSICLAGTCLACGAACQSLSPCRTATLSCATGTPVCTDSGNAADGKSCGTDQVCSAGACVQCKVGESCVPTNACHLGTLVCASGPVCNDSGTNAQPGTPCGTDKVCSSGGSCIACAAGSSCTSTNPCHTATLVCSSGSPVCTDGGNQPDGTTCGTNQVCLAGTCTACSTLACTPANPCHNGTLSCSGGTSSCVDSGTSKPDGTSCGGAGLACFAGRCSRTVTGTRLLSYWPDSGQLPGVPANSGFTVQAFAPDGAGGTLTLGPVNFDASGGYTIPNVPQGNYFLDLVQGATHRMVETSVTVVDLGFDYLGRADQARPTAPPAVTYAVSGLDSWTANAGVSGVGDIFEVTSSNAGAFDFPIGPFYGVDFPAGATGTPAAPVTRTANWTARLIDAGKGDTTYFHQLATKTAGTLPFRTASRSALLSNVTIANQAPVTIPVELGPVAHAGSLLVDWKLSQFDARLPEIHPAAVAFTHSLFVSASPHTILEPSPLPLDGSPQLFQLNIAPGAGDQNLGTLPYGQVFDPTLWTEWRGVDYVACVTLNAPGAATGRPLCGRISRQGEPTSPAPSTPIVPTLTPPRTPLVNGLDAFQPRTGVTTTPTLSWLPPAVGTPTHYRIWIYRLSLSGTGTAFPSFLAEFLTASTSVKVPPGLLQVLAGTGYAAVIRAESLPLDDFAVQPFRYGVELEQATALTSVFVP